MTRAPSPSRSRPPRRATATSNSLRQFRLLARVNKVINSSLDPD